MRAGCGWVWGKEGGSWDLAQKEWGQPEDMSIPLTPVIPQTLLREDWINRGAEGKRGREQECKCPFL